MRSIYHLFLKSCTAPEVASPWLGTEPLLRIQSGRVRDHQNSIHLVVQLSLAAFSPFPKDRVRQRTQRCPLAECCLPREGPLLPCFIKARILCFSSHACGLSERSTAIRVWENGVQMSYDHANADSLWARLCRGPPPRLMRSEQGGCGSRE